ncbi:MAG: patatin-like phospholipase family protein [bacterium]
MNQHSLAKGDLLGRLTGSGPKRILALDGGGIRGVITLGMLERLESVLRNLHGKPDLRLADYFDLIGGTSTGAIIAAGLSVGMSTAEVGDAYLKLGASILSRRKMKVWQSLLDENPLREGLKSYLGEIRMGDTDIRTGLCIVAKRADTNSTWPLHNHPTGKFYGENRSLLLREVVRASAAAPFYFVPEKLDIGGGIRGLFVDGAVSLSDNPAWLLFSVATLKGYSFRWPTGADRLLLVSVGTGSWPWEEDCRQRKDKRSWDWILSVPQMMMKDASEQTELILQYLSRSPTARHIDEEVGSLDEDMLTGEPALSYLRYNVSLDQATLERLGLKNLVNKLGDIQDMASTKSVDALTQIGRASAGQIDPGHFPSVFNIAL